MQNTNTITAIKSINDLSFVDVDSNWSVPTPGDYFTDSLKGMEYAYQFMKLIEHDKFYADGNMLRNIANDMGGQSNGYVAGFWNFIGYALYVATRYGDIDEHYDRAMKPQRQMIEIYGQKECDEKIRLNCR